MPEVQDIRSVQGKVLGDIEDGTVKIGDALVQIADAPANIGPAPFEMESALLENGDAPVR